VRKRLVAGAVALGVIVALTALMLPLRAELAVATCALILVVPVVVGTALGGIPVGAAAATLAFGTYDLLFVPPYGSFTMDRAQNWIPAGVYAAVVVVVARLTAKLERSRSMARQREEVTRRLYELSESLIGDKPLEDLLRLIASTIHQAFGARWVAVLMPEGATLAVAATAGERLSADELGALAPAPGQLQSLRAGHGAAEVVQLALSARGHPVGLVALAGIHPDGYDRQLLATYANQAALAIERSRLREQAMRSEILEEADRWRDALMSAVSHDLRTPLASMKAAVSTLRGNDVPLSDADRAELLELIEDQTDALDRLVTDLLDMTRIRAGALELRRQPVVVADLVSDALRVLGSQQPSPAVSSHLPADLPAVDVDPVLMVQVFANLLENAARYSPAGAAVEVTAAAENGTVTVAVRDHGPGIPAEERQRVFEMYNRIGGGGRAGLGLTIAKAFVEAHGEHIVAREAEGGGAELVFSMARAADVPA